MKDTGFWIMFVGALLSYIGTGFKYGMNNATIILGICFLLIGVLEKITTKEAENEN